MQTFRLAWVSSMSMLLGVALFSIAPQAQDLFVEYHASGNEALLYWTQFYLIFLLFWYFPIYFSARWIVETYHNHSKFNSNKSNSNTSKATSTAKFLATGCVAAILIGQITSLNNVPDTSVTGRAIEDIKVTAFSFYVLLFTLLIVIILAARSGYNLKIGTRKNVTGSDYVKILGVAIGVSIASLQGLSTGLFRGDDFSEVDEQRLLLALAAIGWLAVAVGSSLVALALIRRKTLWVRYLGHIIIWATALLPAFLISMSTIILMGAALLFSEVRTEFNLAHLILLPIATFAIGSCLFFLVLPLIEKYFLNLVNRPDASTSISDDVPTRKPKQATERFTFLVFVVLSISTLLVFMFVHPGAISTHLHRALLAPVLLGGLIPALTLLSAASFRWNFPFVLIAVIGFAIISVFGSDRNDVRTVKQIGSRYDLKESLDKWAKANDCNLGSDVSSCPDPIIVSASGGASRAAFLTASVLGKLIDQTTGPRNRALHPFHKQLFSISGVSGGALGAAAVYAALADRRTGDVQGSANGLLPPCLADSEDAIWFGGVALSDQKPNSWRSCLQLFLAGDFLSPIFISLLGGDLIWDGRQLNRALVLEDAWERRYSKLTGKNTMALSLTHLRKQVHEANTIDWLPLLFLNGTSVTTGRRIITSDADTTLSKVTHGRRTRAFRDAYDMHELLAPKSAAIGGAFSPNGDKLLVKFADGERVYKPNSGSISLHLPRLADGSTSTSEWSPDGAHLISWTASGIVQLRNQEGKIEKTFEVPEGQISGLVVSPNGDQIFLWSERASGGSTARVWSMKSNNWLLEFKSDNQKIEQAIFNPNGSHIFTVTGEDGALRESTTGKIVFEVKGTRWGKVKFSSDGRYIMTVPWDHGYDAKLINATTGQESYQRFHALNSSASPFFSNTGKSVLVFLSDGSAQIYDTTSDILVRSLKSQEGSALGGRFDPTGKRLLTWYESGVALLWDVDVPRKPKLLKGHEGRVVGAIFNNKGDRVLTWSDNGLARLWNSDTGQELKIFRMHAREKCDRCDVRLSTAVTMSARFPVISPHGNIRGASGMIADRVVDGGYYENFGAVTALELADVLRVQFKLRPKIILINNEPETTGMNCIAKDSQMSRPSPPETIFFSTLVAPFSALWQTRNARGTHAAVELCTRIGAESFAFITVGRKRHVSRPVSMSWWLSNHIQKYLNDQIDSDHGPNKRALERITSWRIND